MDIFVWSTIVLSIWSAVGSLVGVWFGGHIAQRSQREHWVADNKRQEYRDLLTDITDAYLLVMRNSAPMVAYSPEEQKERDDAERKSLETVRNRLFINDALEREKIMDLWTKALRDMDHTKDMQLFKKRYEEVEIAIRKLAREVIS
jgi:hypothetical protein